MDESQYIYAADTQQSELDKTKEVKMQIPVKHLIRLHSLKLLAGQNISETVAKALTVYFEQLDAQKRTSHASAAEGADEAVDVY